MSRATVYLLVLGAAAVATILLLTRALLHPDPARKTPAHEWAALAAAAVLTLIAGLLAVTAGQ